MDELKVGARNNSKDQARLQSIHDYVVENGAQCGGKMEEDKSIDIEETLVSFGSEIKALGDNKFGGYLVRFTTQEDPDLTGDFFDKMTDFDVDFPSQSTVYFNHGLDPQLKKRKLGKADIRLDDAGIWAEFILAERDEYEKQLVKMGMAGKLGWSSGTAAHLVEREPAGKAMHIKKWPLGLDASITHTPAEPMNSVIPLKSLSVLTPEADAESTAQKGEDKDIQNLKRSNTMELDETKLQELVSSAIKDGVEKGVEASMKAYVAAQPSETDNIEVVEDEADRALKAGFTPAEFFMAVKNATLYPADTDKRLLPLKANGLNEAIPSQGGFLVSSTIAAGIWERMYNVGSLLSLLKPIEIGPGANGLTINAIDETSRADGSRWGGVRGYWMSEGGTKTASKPTFRQIDLKLKKLAAAVYATDELLQDATALNSWINNTVPQELRFMLEDSIVNGDGVGKPLGYVNGGSAIVVNPATVNTVVAADLLSMWSQRWLGANDYVWLADQSVVPQLAALTVGQVPVWLPPNGMIGSLPQGSLLGRPLHEVEYCAALSSTDYFLHLISPSAIAMIQKGGIQSAESMHVQFMTDESVFRFVMRADAEPYWNTTLTTKAGGTVAPFVLLGSTTP